MAIVLDRTDPKGLGMFSKVGRQKAQKYIIFNKKDEIMKGIKKTKKISAYTHVVQDVEDKKTQEQIDEEIRLTKQQLKIKMGIEMKPTVKKLKVIKRFVTPPKRAPPIGHYQHIKYSQTKPKLVGLTNYYKQESRRRFPKRPKTAYLYNKKRKKMRPMVQRLKPKIVGPIKMDRQLNRKGFLGFGSIDPHPERFNYLKLPRNCSRKKKCITFDIAKKPKKTKTMYKNLEYAPNYNPDHEYVRKQLGTSGPQFQSKEARKPIYRVATASSEKFFFQDDKSKSDHTSKYAVRVQTPNIYRSLPRNRNKYSKLPSFMQKYSGNRQTLNVHGEKMMDMNHFTDGRFQTLVSGFKLKNRKKKTLQFEDDNFFDSDMQVTRPNTMMGNRPQTRG